MAETEDTLYGSRPPPIPGHPHTKPRAGQFVLLSDNDAALMNLAQQVTPLVRQQQVEAHQLLIEGLLDAGQQFRQSLPCHR